MNGRILVVDDEAQIVRVLRGYLEQAGFSVLSAADGPEAVRLVRQEKPDAMVLDLMLPGMDGLEVCRTIRKEFDLPILMLTARVEEADTLVGLELGADDYVTKPFSPREVVARVRALLRRARAVSAAPSEQPITVGALRLDPGRRILEIGDRAVDLTPSEFDILRALMSSPGRVLTRAQLLDATQGYAYEGYERTIDTHIKNLRHKMGDSPRDASYIQTVHGVGYRFREE